MSGGDDGSEGRSGNTLFCLMMACFFSFASSRFEVESSSYMSSAAGWHPQANTHASIRVSSRQSIEALVGV
eukprot:COSAG01_NODE_23741_length_803_cov_1.272727_2_plen_71_part_00